VIREATAADIPLIVSLGADFHATPQWGGTITFDPESFAKTATRVIETGVIFLSGRGLIGLRASPSIYNYGQEVVSELFFWAPDGRGNALRRAAEQWAAGRVLVLGAHEPADPRIEHWYRRAGYVPIGRQFAKVV
jgi:hypothetical protein